MILIASMFLLPFKFLMLSHIPLKDCHMSFLCTLWHVFQNERRKKSLLLPTKSHTKNEKQIRQKIQHEAQWEKESDKRRSKLLGFPHSTHSFTGLILFSLFFWDGLHNLTSPPNAGRLAPLTGKTQERTE